MVNVKALRDASRLFEGHQLPAGAPPSVANARRGPRLPLFVKAIPRSAIQIIATRLASRSRGALLETTKTRRAILGVDANLTDLPKRADWCPEASDTLRSLASVTILTTRKLLHTRLHIQDRSAAPLLAVRISRAEVLFGRGRSPDAKERVGDRRAHHIAIPLLQTPHRLAARVEQPVEITITFERRARGLVTHLDRLEDEPELRARIRLLEHRLLPVHDLGRGVRSLVYSVRAAAIRRATPTAHTNHTDHHRAPKPVARIQDAPPLLCPKISKIYQKPRHLGTSGLRVVAILCRSGVNLSESHLGGLSPRRTGVMLDDR